MDLEVPAGASPKAGADATTCDLLNECCTPCPQGCDQGQCRISVAGDWDDGTGNTIHVFQNQADLLMTYVDGPQAGWSVTGRFIGRLLIEGDFAPDQQVTGSISADGTSVAWSSGGGGWTRKK
jgi:hypothetical protein